MKPIFLTDIDGVLISWQSGLVFFLNDKGLRSDHIVDSIATERYMGLSEIFDIATGRDLSYDEQMDLVNEYNGSDYIRYLPAYTDAIDCVSIMAEHYTFIGVTALSGKVPSLSYSNRKSNLDVLFPNVFEDIIITEVFGSKYTAFNKIIEKYGIDNIYAYVDDLEHNLDAFRKAVSHTAPIVSPLIIRFDRRDNGEPKFDDVITVTDWYEIEDLIIWN
tara:strand:- start:286 stop:939 length:654 start_codon:yes stop_codon:yes gene_type:complete